MDRTNQTWRTLLQDWGLAKLKLTTGFLDLEFEPNDKDRQAAWELYVELLTRVATQPLPPGHGDEAAALRSLYSLFPTVREVLRRNGSDCIEMTKLAVLVLNQIVRPVTTKWHGWEMAAQRDGKNVFDDPKSCKDFRQDLHEVQTQLRRVQRALAYIAQVEDLTQLEAIEEGPFRSGQ